MAIEHYNASLIKSPQAALAHLGLGNIYGVLGRPVEAMEHYSMVLTHPSHGAAAHTGLATALMNLGETQQAIRHYREALRREPNHFVALHNLAAIHAMHPDPRFRDGAIAVRLAQRACELTGYRSPEGLDTLAAAYARNGEFDRAVETIRQAMELAERQRKTRLRDRIEGRLAFYENEQPYLADETASAGDLGQLEPFTSLDALKGE